MVKPISFWIFLNLPVLLHCREQLLFLRPCPSRSAISVNTGFRLIYSIRLHALCRHRVYCYLNRILQHGFANFRMSTGIVAEKTGFVFLWNHPQYFVYIIDKTHIQHAVCFVQNENFYFERSICLCPARSRSLPA